MKQTQLDDIIRKMLLELINKGAAIQYYHLASQIVNDPKYGLNRKQHRSLRRRISQIHKELCPDTFGDSEQRNVTESAEEAVYEYKGTKRITSFDEAVKHCGVDLSVWEIEKKVFNAWDVTMKDKAGMPVTRTNYQYKLWFKRKEPVDGARQLVESYMSSRGARLLLNEPVKNSEVAVHALADFHFGAYVDNLRKTPDFNFSIIVEYLQEICRTISGQKNKKNHVFLLGDFIESFTGMNHKNSWKGLHKGAHGVHSIILAYEILGDFLSNVPNLGGVYMVKGNHDRTSADKEEDMEGGAAKMLWYMLKRDFKDVTFDPMVNTAIIDGIHYLLAHGDLGISRKSVGDFMFKYGIQGYYNLGLQGHLHSVRKKTGFQVVDGVIEDQVNYQMRNISPLFTGNMWSEAEGWTSSSGFTTVRNNGKGKPNITDYLL